jgi:HEPN domain-containing protein
MQLNQQELEALAGKIESVVENPEETARRIEKKTGAKGIFGTIRDFIKSYEQKDKDTSNEAWLENQFARPEYSDAWKGSAAEQAAERQAAAKGIVQGVEDYENAKKSLASHIADNGGDRASWLAEQIEIGAEVNGKDPAEYAKEISRGLDEAIGENAEFIYTDDDKEAQ